MTEQDIEAVREVLRTFQEGYIHRDLAALDGFRALFAGGADVEVIGTGGVEPGGDEWCMDAEAALTLVKNDWEGWGDFRIDVPGARIHVLGEAAWLATSGTVTMTLKPEDVYRDYVDYLRQCLQDDALSPRDRLIETLRGASNTLKNAEHGSEYIWPIRFTAVLTRQGAGWVFRQMQFSFATTSFPDVRR